ncbi:MAG: hypothetical protein WCK51_10660 [Armatimonadota bacterium]
MDRILTFGKCFADPIAIRIIRVTYRTPSTIQDLQAILELDRHTVDLRLLKLREAAILKPRQDGRWLTYEMNPDMRPVIKGLITSFYDEVKWSAECLEDDRRYQELKAVRTSGED